MSSVAGTIYASAFASLLLGAFLWAAVIPWIKYSPMWKGWRKFRFLHSTLAAIAEWAAALLLGLLFFYCFSHPANFLSWVVIVIPLGFTLWYSARYLWHRYTPTPLLWRFAEYRDSGNLDEASRQSLTAAADALDGPFDARKAEAQIQRLQEVVRTVEHDFVMPVMEDAQAQLAYLQSRILATVLQREGISSELEELPHPHSPEVRALWELARHRRDLREIPTKLVKSDVAQMKELYEELTGLGRAGQQFMTLTEQIARSNSQTPAKSKPRISDLADKIFAEASRDTQTRAQVWRRFDEEVRLLREEVAAGHRDAKEVEREIENMRDYISKRLEEL